jgi:hypothetical protein
MWAPDLHNPLMAALWDRIDAELTRRGMGWADLGRKIGATDQTMHNWKTRGGIPAARYKAIADCLGWSIDAMLSDDWTPAQHPNGGPHLGVREPAPAHYMSHPPFEDAPSVIAWERILKEPLKAEFQTLMPDASMEPDVPRGARVIFVTGVEVEPGDWALVRDPDGHLYLRVIRQLKPGRWEAHALNPAFLPMDSERDGLAVVAVFDGVRGRKARV